MHYFYLSLLVLTHNGIDGHSNFKENVTSVSDTSRTTTTTTTTEDTSNPILQGLLNYFQDKKQDDAKGKKSAQNKANVLKNVAHEKNFDTDRDIPSSKLTVTGSKDKNIGRHYFHLDTVFNSLNNRRFLQKSKSSSSSESESLGWVEEMAEKRLRLKFEAANSTQPRGDVVHMNAARPWGIKCGDPNLYDMPWGTCMLPAECDAEYRIHRGDSFCGRSQFVCCALERTAYDMYQGLDLSFERDNSLTTDTEDEQNNNSKDRKRKKRKHEKKKRNRIKAQMKKKIRNSIKKIISEITKLLQKGYRNGTTHRNKMTKELKQFIKKMKKQYRKDRNSLVDAHAFNMAKYDIQLAASLNKVRGLNEAFMSNDTFRDIVVNGTVNKANLLRLQQTHPVLSLFFNHRRMGGGDLEPEPDKIKLETEEEVPKSENIKLETEGAVSEPVNINIETEGEVPEPENIKLDIEGEVSEREKENPELFEYDLEYGMLYY